MSDWIGLIVLILFALGIYLGLKILSRPRKLSENEFEQKAAEGGGLAGAGMQALHELLNPEAGKSKEVQMELKEGRFHKKKREGKADGNENSES
jgi:hypothetical protein